VYRHRRAGASALTKLSRWPVGIVALVHVVALARRKRATVLAFFFFFFTGWILLLANRLPTLKHREFCV
jgi:hypothetical protein